MIYSATCASRNPDVFDQVLDVLGRRGRHVRHDVGNTEVDQCADGTEGVGLDAQEPVR